MEFLFTMDQFEKPQEELITKDSHKRFDSTILTKLPSCIHKSMFIQLCDKTIILSFIFLILMVQLLDWNSNSNEIGKK